MKTLLKLTLLVLLMGPVGARAVTITVTDGQLVSAWDILVDGVAYDVSFQEGTCIELFNGCDNSIDFIFDTQQTVEAASLALLNQVFLDTIEVSLDSFPNLTVGCSFTPHFCAVLTPFTSQLPFLDLRRIITVNETMEIDDRIITARTSFGPSTDTTFFADVVYAVWSTSPVAVPEPGAIALLLTGFAAMGLGRQRKRKRKPTAR